MSTTETLENDEQFDDVIPCPRVGAARGEQEKVLREATVSVSSELKWENDCELKQSEPWSEHQAFLAR